MLTFSTGFFRAASVRLFDRRLQAQILTADWRRLYNALRPHSSLGQRPPAPETIVWQGFKLSDVAPPAPTPELSMALT